jgi:Mg-chelatase subunit ChlD
MTPRNRLAQLAVLIALAALAAHLAGAQTGSPPLAEDKIIRMIELKIKPEVISGMIQKQGLGFTADAASLGRLKAANVPEAVLEAVRKAGEAKPAAAPAEKPVTYQDIVELLNVGVPESEIVDRLKQSPTTFTLSKEQTDILKRLGATEKLLGAMGSVRATVGVASEVNNLAIVFDCSGSMSERTAEGRTKMDAAREAAIKLVQETPDGVRLSFIIYGHDRALACGATRVVRALGPIDAKGKAELVGVIGRLQPVGATPISLALQVAGRELATANAPSGLILISDGKESCGGDPTAEAAALTKKLKLDFGVQVVGFGVKPDEQQALGEIAQAGHGKYFDAPNPAALRDVVQVLARHIVEEIAEPAPVVVEEPELPVTDPAVQALIDQLSDNEFAVRGAAARGLKDLGDKSAVSALVKRVADDRWQFNDENIDSNCSKTPALEAIRSLAPAKVRPALVLALKSKNVHVRFWAVTQLGVETGPKEGETESSATPAELRAISDRLFDTEFGVRGAAARSLKKIGNKAAVPALVKRISDDVWQFNDENIDSNCSKGYALEALRALAPEQVRPVLIAAMKSKNPHVKTWATTALTAPPKDQ